MQFTHPAGIALGELSHSEYVIPRGNELVFVTGTSALVTISLPRVRDFRGVSAKSFDGRGNYNMGVKEQIIFPEIEYDKIDALRGMNITITTTAKTDEEARALLAAFKFPFKG